MMKKHYFLGLDGGGTKTEAVLCDESGHILSRHLMGPTNPNDIGIEESVTRLCALIKQVQMTLTEGKIYLFGGIAGALNHRQALVDKLETAFPNDHISVHSDAINLLSSELYHGQGCCLICGTGSVCFLREGEILHRIGGWGYLLDRAGSGFSIGREALEAVLRCHDGRGDATLLTGALREALGGWPWDSLTKIYEGGKAYIASLAPCVLACAEEGDRVAFEILFRQAVYLAECLDAAQARFTSSEEPLEVVLGGGLLQTQSILISLIEQNVTAPIKMTVASAPPVFGAVWEAVRSWREAVTEKEYMTFKQTFCKDYVSIQKE